MKVKFLPMNVECEIKPGQSVLHVAQDNNIHIKSVCRGVPSCAECRVRVVDGDYNVVQPSSTELSLIGTAWFVDRRRLSCQLRCFGDITVDLTEQVARQESTSGKKPRGRYNKDELQESRAVLGNLVMNDEDADRAAVGVIDAGDDEANENEGHSSEADDSDAVVDGDQTQNFESEDDLQRNNDRELTSGAAPREETSGPSRPRANLPTPNSGQPNTNHPRPNQPTSQQQPQARDGRPSSPNDRGGGPRPTNRGGGDKSQQGRGGGRNNRRRNNNRGGGGNPGGGSSRGPR